MSMRDDIANDSVWPRIKVLGSGCQLILVVSKLGQCA